jgi:hypothetical protein
MGYKKRKRGSQDEPRREDWWTDGDDIDDELLGISDVGPGVCE